jgi:hypothetical protein
MPNLSHIKFDGFTTALDYKYPKSSNGKVYDQIERNRATHGGYLLEKANRIKQYFEIENLELQYDGLIKDDVIYVEFTSEWGYKLSFDSFDKNGVKDGDKIFNILNVKEEAATFEGKEIYRYSLVVLVNEKGILEFIKKINEYLNKNHIKTDRITKEKIDTGNPKNKKILNNIGSIELATLKSFWVDEPEIPFPSEDEDVWWEVWFRKKVLDNNQLDNVLNNLTILGCKIGLSTLTLTEHIVKLVKGNRSQLSESLLLLDNLAELRKPQEIADFILHGDVSFDTKREYLQDLINRTDSQFDDNSVLICLLDSGVNNQHPLINPFLSDNHLYTFKDSWGLQDSQPHAGHGTGVGGLALYGDLTDVLSSSERIQIYHGLESYKVYHHNDPNNPELYGAITESGVNTPIIDRPSNLRVYCLTVTDKNFRFKGRPSAWSAAIDKICLGDEFGSQLFIVSGGNVSVINHIDYPSLNYTETVHDPAQAYNAITIGTYTRKDKIDISSGLSPLASNGNMAPSNTTSLLFDKNWPIKPDVVFEGSNLASDGVFAQGHESLDLVSLHKDFNNNIFSHFGDTSAAAGLASKMAAEIRTKYTAFWPETIRALMIHSADWTSQMLDNRRINSFNEQEKINLLRTVGYGVPNLSKALNSANNSLTLIAERSIQPYKKDGSDGKYNEFHLFELPWPKEALIDLSEKDVTLKVTLSYYIEPNPGSRRFVSHHQYHSHQLDFIVIKPLENVDTFKNRVSAASKLEDEEMPKRTGEPWMLGRTSTKGSIRKDFVTMPGAQMSERNVIAVYPKNGWYKNLKRQNKFNSNVRYSLIISIETPETSIDLYTPVFNQLAVLV